MNRWVFYFMVFGLIPGFSQNVLPDILSSAGGRSKSEAISLHWTIGELTVRRENNGDLNLSEGFHQLYINDMSTLLPDIEFLKGVFIYPNPCMLSLHIYSENSGRMDFKVYDSQGKYIMQGQFFKTTSIEVDQLKVGNYFILVTTDKKMRGLYPFIKV